MSSGVIDGHAAPKRLSSAPRWADDGSSWAWATLGVIFGVSLLRTLIVWGEPAPLHFDEAQYWAYGEALDWGYYSKPPMVAWLIRASTEVFGDTVFGVRAMSPWIQAWIAWLVFAIARRLFDARAGFWASAAYLTLPGVTVAGMLMTTDPPMMAAWALALYALVRAIDTPSPGRVAGADRLLWWALAGGAVGLGLLSKYTIVAFFGGVLGYALFSRDPARGASRAAAWRGPAAMIAAAIVVWSPNLAWNAANDFASISHVGDNARLGGGPAFDVVNAVEFAGAQIGIAGPIVWIAFLWAAWSGAWRQEWSGRLLMWLAAPLPIAMTIQAFLSRAHPNWAAPAYIAIVILAIGFLADRDRRAWLISTVALGASMIGVAAGVAFAYDAYTTDLPRLPDPFKKMRLFPEVCARIDALAEPGEILLSHSRPLLSVCMFEQGRTFADVRTWSGPQPRNHFQLAAPLTEADQGPGIVAFLGPIEANRGALEWFDAFEVLEEGAIRTHADREETYSIVRFRGLTPP